MTPITALTPKGLPRSYMSFETLLGEVRPYLPNAADTVMLNATRRSAIDFCRMTGLWLYQFDPIIAVPWVNDYDVPTPDSTAIVFFSEIWYGGRRIDPQSLEQLKKRYVNDFNDTAVYNGPPSWYWHDDLCSIKLVPCPNENPDNRDTITGWCALMPTSQSLGLPADIGERWFEGIAYGARARMCRMPDTPYFNQSQAMQYDRMAMNEIAKGRIAANQARTRGPLTVNRRPYPGGPL